MVKLKYKQKGGKNMLKKVFGTLAVLAFVFGAVSHTSIPKNLVDACSYVCCEHDGDGWDN